MFPCRKPIKHDAEFADCLSLKRNSILTLTKQQDLRIQQEATVKTTTQGETLQTYNDGPLKGISKSGMAAHICNPRIWKWNTNLPELKVNWRCVIRLVSLNKDFGGLVHC